MPLQTFRPGDLPVALPEINPFALASALSAGADNMVASQVPKVLGAGAGVTVAIRPELSVLAYLASELGGYTNSRIFVADERLQSLEQGVKFAELVQLLGGEPLIPVRSKAFDNNLLEPLLHRFKGKTNLVYLSLDGVTGNEAELTMWFRLIADLLAPGGAAIVSHVEDAPANVLVTDVPRNLREFCDASGRVGIHRVKLEADADGINRLIAGGPLTLVRMETSDSPVEQSIRPTRELLTRLGFGTDADPLTTYYPDPPTVHVMLFRKS